jgi:hypothetical protein
MIELSRNLFWSGITELLVIGLAIWLKNDKRKMVMVLAIGTFIAGAIGFGSPVWRLAQERMRALPALSLATQQSRPTAIQLIPDFQTISLQSFSELSSPETNLGLAPGRNYLLDIPFDTGWKASTQCSYLPNQPESFQLEASISNPTNVYLLIQAGWGLVKYDGMQIGNVRLGFSDGSNLDTPLTLGLNIRDWAWENPAAVNTVSSPESSPAWEGNAPDGTPGGMDVLTIDIPRSQSELTLTSIQIADQSWSTVGESDPCIHLVALTVKYLH